MDDEHAAIIVAVIGPDGQPERVLRFRHRSAAAERHILSLVHDGVEVIRVTYLTAHDNTEEPND
jgi:hypothetical protein